jgi:hypothetical protein
VPLYPLSKHVLLSLVVCFPVVSCGDGGFDPSEPIDVTVVSGDGQSADVGQTLPQNLVVRSSDLDGNTLGNVDLVFSVVQGGGSLGATAVTTNAQGMASTTWTMGTQEGPQQVAVSAGTNSFASRDSRRFPIRSMISESSSISSSWTDLGERSAKPDPARFAALLSCPCSVTCNSMRPT